MHQSQHTILPRSITLNPSQISNSQYGPTGTALAASSVMAPDTAEKRLGQMARGAGIVGILSLIAAGTGFARESFFALRFGTSTPMDAYVAAMLPSRLISAIAAGSLVPSFIGVFVRLYQSDRQEAWNFASAAANSTLVWLTAVLVLGAFTARWWLSALYPGYAPATLDLTLTVALILTPSASFLALSAVQGGLLNSLDHFSMPAIFPAMASLIVIAGVLVSRGEHGIFIASAATCLSFVAQPLAQHALAKRMGHRPTRPWCLSHPAMKEWLLLSVPLLIYQAVAFGSNIVEARLASQLGAGAVSCLGYANRLFTIPVTLLATPLATVAYPTLSRHVVNQEWSELQKNFVGSIRMALFVFLPAVAWMTASAYPLTKLFFEHGAFGSAATDTTASVLAILALGILPNAIAILVLRCLYSLREMKIPVYCEAFSLALYLAVAPVLSHHLTLRGLALARTLAFLSTAALLYWRLNRKLKLTRLGDSWSAFLFRTVTAALVIGILCGTIVDYNRAWFARAPLLFEITAFALLTSASIAFYLWITDLLNVGEARLLKSWVYEGMLRLSSFAFAVSPKS